MTTTYDSKTSKANFKKARMLIVEDNADHWTLIENAMQHCMPEISLVRADSSRRALGLLGEWSLEEWELPKLILLDLYLPKREDGWKLLQEIKVMPAPCNQIPVVMLSASNQPSDINEAYQRGSSSYLIKPIVFTDWILFFSQLRTYWWETVTLPPTRFSI